MSNRFDPRGEQSAGGSSGADGRGRSLEPDLARARAVAVDAARGAGALLRRREGSVREVRHKGLVDIVTDVDVQSEKLVRQVILEAFPHHTIVGEEGGAVLGQDSQARWIVDPLDGTTNYAHGYPVYCVSIAFEVAGVLQVGVVYDPTRDELFEAIRGQGATLNGASIGVSCEADLMHALLVTGFPYERTQLPRALEAFGRLSHHSQAVRRIGSAALDLCYVACGRFDGYWEYVVSAWDVAAGALLVQEAGGVVTVTDGSPFTLSSGEVLASNGLVHEALVAELAAVETARG